LLRQPNHLGGLQLDCQALGGAGGLCLSQDRRTLLSRRRNLLRMEGTVRANVVVSATDAALARRGDDDVDHTRRERKTRHVILFHMKV
jgi:hypothetical protein